MSEFPQKSRSELAPAKWTTQDKKMGDHFDEAMNAPNNPTKNHQPTNHNVTNDYTDGDNSK